MIPRRLSPLLLVALCIPLLDLTVVAQSTALVSVGCNGTSGPGPSSYSFISADGRFVAFNSSNDLDCQAASSGGAIQVFVRDLLLGTTTLVSVSTASTATRVPGNDRSAVSSISADGRYVVFQSHATDLIPGGSSGIGDVFLRDLQVGTTELVSVSTDGGQSNGGLGGTDGGSISADGCYIVFQSYATNLVSTSVPGGWNVFLRRRCAMPPTTSHLDQGEGPVISADGRFVAFRSDSALVLNDTNGVPDNYELDLLNNHIERVSVDSAGNQGTVQSGVTSSISSDGRFVAFITADAFDQQHDGNGTYDAYVHDRQTSSTELVSRVSGCDGGSGDLLSYDPYISADGRFIVFWSWATNLDSQHQTNGSVSDVFIRDRQTCTTEVVSLDSMGAQGTGGTIYTPTVSADGSRVAFFTFDHLSGADTNAVADVYVRVRGFVAQPTASAGPDQVVMEGDPVVLDGAASMSAVEGEPLVFTWTQIAGPTAGLSGSHEVQPTFTAPLVPIGGATLTFQLVVEEGGTPSHPDYVNVTVNNVNHPPIADAGIDIVSPCDLVVTLDGSGSTDIDGDPLTFEWSQVLGPTVTLADASSSITSFSPALDGACGQWLLFQLTVSDGVDAATAYVFVLPTFVNHPPVANAGPDLSVPEGTSVVLDGSASSDPDLDQVSWFWVQTAGPYVGLSDPTAPAPSFIAPPTGPGGALLTFILYVSDGSLSAQDEVSVQVSDVNDPPDCSAARADPPTLWPPNHKLVPVRIVGVIDPDGSHVTIQILSVTQGEGVVGCGDGDSAPDAVIKGATVLLRAERDEHGDGRVYTVYFRATDQQGGSCEASVRVVVPRNKGREHEAHDHEPHHDSTHH